MSLVVDIKKKLAAFTLEMAFEAEDETVGLLGASGCGKSMTMRCIAGIERPDEGKIVVNGTTYFDSAAHVNLSPQERKTALLFQNYMLFPHLTVAKNIAAGIARDVPRAERDRMVSTEVERFGLSGFERRYPLQLSGGQQQRVALARMLASRPPILMLDEPFSALDAHLKDVLEQSLSTLFDSFDGTILYVSHDIDEAVRFCDRIAVVDAGCIAEIDSSSEIVHSPHSLAALRLSGVKNVSSIEPAGAGRVRALSWGVELESAHAVPEDATAVGIRAFYLERAEGPGVNAFRVRVVRASDARFDRLFTLEVIDALPSDDGGSTCIADADAQEGYGGQGGMHSLFWRVDKLAADPQMLPQVGDELWIRLPPERLAIVRR